MAENLNLIFFLVYIISYNNMLYQYYSRVLLNYYIHVLGIPIIGYGEI